MNKGNQGAAALTAAIRAVSAEQIPKERSIDLGIIQGDYSLLTDTFQAAIPRGSWSVLKHLLIKPCTHEGCTCGHEAIKPGDRVAVVWAGNEAVVIGVVTKL